MAGSQKLSMNLEEILEKTVSYIDDSKDDVFAIVESSRKQIKNIESELELVRGDIADLIDELQEKEKINKRARLKLMRVSKDFENYSEEEIKQVYELAEETSIEIAVLREKEEQLQQRRRELEKRIKVMEKTHRRAESLVSRMGVVKDFLQGRMIDISERIEDLRSKEDFIFKIIEAQEEERKRVAREIHDGPAQSLANLVLRVEIAQKMMQEDKEEADKELEELKTIVKNSVRDVRKIIYDLRPMSLDDLGLVPTLRKYIDNFNESTGIIIEFQVRGEVKELSATYEVTIFRLVQEALNNIKKHAEASSGKVILEFTREDIKILIIDNGKGFEVKTDKEDSYGLVNMRERCSLLQGEFNLNSTKGQGTRINIRLPVKQKG